MLILAIFLVLFLVPANVTPYRIPALEAQFSAMITAFGRLGVFALAVMALTAVFGRLYCAYVCPAGLMQHLFTHIGRWTGLSRLAFRKAAPALSYAVVGATAAYGIIAGSAILFGPVPGYSLLVLPVSDAIRRGYDGAGKYLLDNPVYAATVAALCIMMVIIPIFRGRVFCNRLCPVGIVLSWVSLLPGRRFRIIQDKCAGCGKCEKVCPVGCIDTETKTLEANRCVECWDCVNACGVNAVEKGWGRSGERRSFLSGTTMAALGGMFVFSRKLTKEGGLLDTAAAAEVPVTPPGSGGNEAHALLCIGCQGCVPVCPVGIIRPRNGRPVLDYDYGFCQYNCNRCTRSCPTGALNPLSRSEKQATRLARVSLRIEECVVMTRGQPCGACAEVCPTHAVTMVAQGEAWEAPKPDFDPEYCIGCGACYHVCPETPRTFSMNGLEKQEKSKGIRFADQQREEKGRERHGERQAKDAEKQDGEGDGGLTDFPF